MAVESHTKAHKAQQSGLFDSEIVPVKTTVLDKDGNSKQVTVTKDDGIRQ
jgi:acetyl-CoA acyltransferase 1